MLFTPSRHGAATASRPGLGEGRGGGGGGHSATPALAQGGFVVAVAFYKSTAGGCGRVRISERGGGARRRLIDIHIYGCSAVG